MERFVLRPFIASLCVAATLATGSIAASAASPAPATPAPPPNVSSLHPSTVLTDINGYVTATSASRQRLVVVGQDLDQRPFVAANTTYTIIDIARHNLIMRRNTNGTIDNTVIDDRRGVVYLTVQTVPDRISGAGTSYHVDLWTIRLSDGRLLSRRLFYEGEAATMNAMGVDESTGHLFIATTRPGSGTYELLMIDPASMDIHIQSLEGIPDHVFVDSVHHQAVVTTQVGIAAQTSKFIAFDTRSENRTWSHLFQYILSSYANFAMVYNPGTQQIWSVAPGGLVTVVAASNGQVVRQIQMGYTRPDGWAQVGFALDATHNMGYAQWAGTACNIDRADRNADVRNVAITYSGSPCGTAGSTLIAVDEGRQLIVTADASAMHVFNTHGKEVRTISLINAKGAGSSWFTDTTIQQGGHMSVVFISDVDHQNEATGTVTTGAAIFVPLS